MSLEMIRLALLKFNTAVKLNCLNILDAKIFLKRIIEIVSINLEKYNSIIQQKQREYNVSIRPSNHGKDVLCHA